MFAGGRRRSSNNVRAMQLFHELKQQFPTVPDHVVTACITNATDAPSPSNDDLRKVLEAAANLQQELMARNHQEEANNNTPDDPDRNAETMSRGGSKRPDTLNFEDGASRIRQSDKCKDVHKLLNFGKPPKSPGKKTEPPPRTAETPTQTTNTLITPNVNLSLNVNCSMDVRRHTSALHVVPQQSWSQDVAASPRSYTSVNLTLRPPSSEPQPPIDITSRNSSLTYSTSSFDPQKGLQSKLEITVSPTGGSVSSVRTRPRSFHDVEDDGRGGLVHGGRVASLQNLSTSPVLTKQQVRMDRLKIEVQSERRRLVAVHAEVRRLENSRNDASPNRVDVELERQLEREIRHLRCQCERLAIEVDSQTEVGVPLGETSEEFYRNIYKGQVGSLGLSGRPSSQQQHRIPQPQQQESYDGWSCSMCTFQNHPLLDECEQCNMARIVHGMSSPRPSRSLSELLAVQTTLDAGSVRNAAKSLLQYVTGSCNDGAIDHVRSELQALSAAENSNS